jgi:hypothetical protein
MEWSPDKMSNDIRNRTSGDIENRTTGSGE